MFPSVLQKQHPPRPYATLQDFNNPFLICLLHLNITIHVFNPFVPLLLRVNKKRELVRFINYNRIFNRHLIRWKPTLLPILNFKRIANYLRNLIVFNNRNLQILNLTHPLPHKLVPKPSIKRPKILNGPWCQQRIT